jgi:hypothetical protein
MDSRLIVLVASCTQAEFMHSEVLGSSRLKYHPNLTKPLYYTVCLVTKAIIWCAIFLSFRNNNDYFFLKSESNQHLISIYHS